jgi:excisionase family DNA binding protein
MRHKAHIVAKLLALASSTTFAAEAETARQLAEELMKEECEPEPLLASPKEACALLNCGLTRLYQLLHDGELESYLDGGARKITMASIHGRVARLIASGMPPERRPGRDAPDLRKTVSKRREAQVRGRP